MNKHKPITFEENKFWKYQYGDVSVVYKIEYMECYEVKSKMKPMSKQNNDAISVVSVREWNNAEDIYQESARDTGSIHHALKTKANKYITNNQ